MGSAGGEQQPEAAKSIREQPGRARSKQGQLGATRDSQEQPKQPGAARRGTQGKGPRNLQKTPGRWEAPKRHF